MEKSYIRIVVRTVAVQLVAIVLIGTARLLPDVELGGFVQGLVLLCATGLCLLTLLLPAPVEPSNFRCAIEGLKDPVRISKALLIGAFKGARTLGRP
ncbi:hypothetical protein [Piscinibacterium candidicorallinum]|uniref:Uncharacterized protein n=1 Tax=Piscinibacterium candidicorallinum TaxID=1793872 RepID=A0ABV7H975_9BURK